MAVSFLQQTWFIWTISPFAIPMTNETVRDIETNLTNFLRQQSDLNSKLDMEGSYVTFGVVNLSQDMHVCLEVWTKDEPAAQLILAYSKRAEDGVSIAGFGFCLLRGPRKAVDPVLLWLEATTGCVFGNAVFKPTSEQIAQVLSAFAKSTKAPLEVTFQAPSTIAGIEKLLFTVPPLALQKLVNEIEMNRPTDQAVENVELPILKALHCYMKETFKMNLESFSVVKVKSGIGTLGADGKCKFLDVDEQETLMTIMLRMIESQIHSAPQPGAWMVPIVDDDEDDEHIEAVPI